MSVPAWFVPVISAFSPLFSRRVWPQARRLLIGAILAPGKRTVSAALRVLGLADDTHFVTDQRARLRARWSSLHASRILLCLLVNAFVPTGPLILGLDNTIERCKGPKINARGIYRDPVRSSHRHVVKISGL